MSNPKSSNEQRTTQQERHCGFGRNVAAVVFVFGMGCWCLAFAQGDFATEIEAISERTSLAPNESITRLTSLQNGNKELSVDESAMLYEQLNRAHFFARDFTSALQYGKLIESLGKRSGNRTIECSGQLAQVYSNWRLGNIEAAYALTRMAEKVPETQIALSVRIQALLTTAQLEADERRPKVALLKIEDALRLAAKSDALEYSVRIIQVKTLLAANDIPRAENALNHLLVLAQRSTFKERLIRARAVEYTVASSAARYSQANKAMLERIRLMKQLQLTEGLGGILVEYANFKLNSGEYSASLSLSKEALGLKSVQLDEQLATMAKSLHALASIQIGHVKEGKAEIEELFHSNSARSKLLNYLPQYSAALTAAGEVDASVQTEILRQKLESEIALARAKQEEKSRGTLENLSRENALSAKESASAHGQRNVWLVVAVLLIAGLVALIWRYVRLRAGARALAEANRKGKLALEDSAMRQSVLRQQAVEAKTRILQAQIEPHFLFNTLANLRYLYRTSQTDGEKMLDHLIGYLRSAMDELRAETSTVGRELQLSRHYLSIMAIRMGDRLQYNISCAHEVIDTPVPPAMLLTLVENAIKHGVQNKQDGRIDIVITRDEQFVWLTVLDNGNGVSSIEGTGVGLANIRLRLQAAFGEHGSLQYGPLPNGGFAASIMLPLANIDETPCQPH